MAVRSASTAVAGETTVLVTMLPGCDTYSSTEMKQYLKQSPAVERFDFADATLVLSREIQSMDTVTRQGLELLTSNPFGDEFIVYVADGYRSTDSINAMTRRLQAMTDVDTVSGDSAALGEVNDGMARILFYCGILALILLIISVVLINNTISLAIYSRRFNIHTMKLVGATDSFIRRPFVRAGMYTGITAGVIAAVLVAAAQCWLIYNDNMVGQWLTWGEVWLTAFALIVIGAIIARSAAWCAATNYLNKTYDSLFKK